MATDTQLEENRRKCETVVFGTQACTGTAAKWEGKPTVSGGPSSFREKAEIQTFIGSLCFFSVSSTFKIILHGANWLMSFQFSTSALHLRGTARLLCETPVGKTVVGNSFISECHCFVVGKREEKRTS